MSGLYREIEDPATNKQEVEISGGTDGTTIGNSGDKMRVDGSGVTQPISAVALPLPTGASTSALQTTGNTSLSSIDTKTPALGQHAMSASQPVAIASDQSAIPVTQSGSWTVTANAGTNLNTSALALDTSVNGILVAQGSTTSGEKGPLAQGAVTTAAPTYTNAQTSPLSLTTAGALRTDASATTQPISAASLPLPTGAATSALQTTGNSSLSSIDTKLTTTNASLATIDAGIPAALGQTTMSASMSVAIASDQSALTTKDVINVSGQYQAITVTTTASEAKGAGTHLTGRKSIWITPTTGIVYWGTSNAVTTSSGTPIYNQQTQQFSFTENVTIYLISTGSVNVRVVEAS